MVSLKKVSALISREAGHSQIAHYAASKGDVAGLRELKQGMDELTAEVWGLKRNPRITNGFEAISYGRRK